MYKKISDMPQITERNPAGGEGFLEKHICLGPDEAPAGIEFVARVFLRPGASVGMHRHEGNGEIWYYLGGEGDYTEDGNTVPVRAGDITVCHSGSSHGICNTGAENLEYIAVKFIA